MLQISIKKHLRAPRELKKPSSRFVLTTSWLICNSHLRTYLQGTEMSHLAMEVHLVSKYPSDMISCKNISSHWMKSISKSCCKLLKRIVWYCKIITFVFRNDIKILPATSMVFWLLLIICLAANSTSLLITFCRA